MSPEILQAIITFIELTMSINSVEQRKTQQSPRDTAAYEAPKEVREAQEQGIPEGEVVTMIREMPFSVAVDNLDKFQNVPNLRTTIEALNTTAIGLFGPGNYEVFKANATLTGKRKGWFVQSYHLGVKLRDPSFMKAIGHKITIRDFMEQRAPGNRVGGYKVKLGMTLLPGSYIQGNWVNPNSNEVVLMAKAPSKTETSFSKRNDPVWVQFNR